MMLKQSQPLTTTVNGKLQGIDSRQIPVTGVIGTCLPFVIDQTRLSLEDRRGSGKVRIALLPINRPETHECLQKFETAQLPCSRAKPLF